MFSKHFIYILEDYAITHGIEDTREVLYVTGSNEGMLKIVTTIEVIFVYLI